ncbi:MAG: hypothetical protein KGY99_03925 [Phycisphaerae bacterium]|nr:hypothetical protein [Phycisphaerae bacterium]
MNGTRKKATDSRPATADPDATAEPADGVPEGSANRAAWKYILLAGIFLAWAGFLLYCALAGNV